MTHITPTTPAATVLSLLTAACRAQRVLYTAVPVGARPPRINIEFNDSSDLRDFEMAVHHLAAAGDAYATLLGRIGDQAADYLTPASAPDVLTEPEVLRHLIVTTASALLVTVEDHGPLKVLELSPQYLAQLQSIAALALAGAVAWQRANAPGEAGDLVQSQPPTMDDVVGEQLAACTDGLRPAIKHGPRIGPNGEVQ